MMCINYSSIVKNYNFEYEKDNNISNLSYLFSFFGLHKARLRL